MMHPPMPPSPVFDHPAHRHAAGVLVQALTLTTSSEPLPPTDAALAVAAVSDEVSPVDLLIAATVVVRKLLDDERTVWHVDPARTLARLGMWVAADEYATRET